MQNNKLLNRLKLHFLRNRSLLIATVISLLLHSLFLSEFALTLPDIEEEHQSLEMRLVELPPKTVTPAPIKKEAPKPEQKAERPKPEVTQTAKTQDINPLSETPIEQHSAVADTPQSSPVIEPVTPESPGEAITPDETADNAEKEQRPTPYQYVESEFEVRRGNDANAAGTARMTFSIKNNGTYKINSTTEAKGLASLFFNRLVQRSEGTVTENGLVPNFFSYEYGKKIQSADFAWSDGVLLMHTEKGDRTEKLVAGTQDLLSFAYQFMFKPPLETMQISITNGKNLRTYVYSFEGEEVISTKLGDLKTVHLLKSGDSEEKTELWLGLDYQYLPVKIRKTEKNGNIIEQTIIKITLAV